MRALETGEGDAEVRRQNGAGHGAVVHAGARGQINRHDPERTRPSPPGRSQGRHQSSRPRAQRTGRTDTGQAIDHEGDPARRGAFARLQGLVSHAHSGALGRLHGRRMRVVGRQRRGDGAAAAGQEGARQQGVTAVMPAPDQEDDTGPRHPAHGVAQLAHGREREGVGGMTHVAIRRSGQVPLGPGDGLGAIGGAW